MQRDSIRMFATAISFDEIKISLAKNYYNGVSSQFYLKNMQNGQLTLLQGDANGEEQGFQTYYMHGSFELGTSYQVIDAYGLVCFLDVSLLSTLPEFDERFYYDGDDLGSHYTRVETTFKVWSPLSTGVILKLKHRGDISYFPMMRRPKGVYEISIHEDLDGYEYTYLILSNDTSVETVDPYAYASSANMQSSFVVNLDRIDNQRHVTLPPLEHKTDAIIYELNVRDFSVNPYGELRHKGKFLALAETGNRTYLGHSSGIDYLEKLGVTHVQLMPINDYATVDEDHPYELYNWGYDPAQYNVTEGSYVTDPNDPYRRISECRDMIHNIHEHGMRVILDVVYNHMYDVNNNAMEKTVPYYFFRRKDGRLTNGTWCGNDFNTTAKMCRKYILDMCKRWQVLYGCDGFRMDLMGIIDIETVNAIEAQGRSIDPSFMLYGEGWDMGTLPQDVKASMNNHAQLPRVSFFNDHFRDTLRGSNQMETKGYTSGDTYKTNEAIIAMCDYNKFTSIEQSINYVECHDNGTVYDKFSISNFGEVESCLERRCTLALAMTILSQGVPFMHQGQEFFDTKGGNTNSYNAGDSVNNFDWGRRDEFYQHVELIAFLIRLRRNNKCFRYYDYDDMRQHVRLSNINHCVIRYELTQDEGEYHEFCIFFNPSYERITVYIDDSFKVLYCMEEESISYGQMTLRGVSMAICAR